MEAAAPAAVPDYAKTRGQSEPLEQVITEIFGDKGIWLN
jgi:hypothetical protein